MNARMLLVAGLVFSFPWLCIAGPLQHSKATVHITYVPGLDDADCGGPGSHVKPDCKKTPFQILAVQGANPTAGAPQVCLAYFGYNALDVHVGKGNGGAELSWQLPPGASFHGNGVVFVLPPGVPLSDIVESQGVGSVKIRKNVLRTGMPFGHLPDIDLNINGVVTHCGGADPGIVVHAD